MIKLSKGGSLNNISDLYTKIDTYTQRKEVKADTHLPASEILHAD